MSNFRIFYAVENVGLSKCGANTFTSIHGLQSVGVSTKFDLQQVFEVGQLSLYDLLENIPAIEATLEKVLDGYPPIYCLATNGATSPSLSGRSNVQATLGLSIYSDSQDSASGTPLAQCTMSGVFVSAFDYTFPTDGNCSESVTLVGNNKVWTNVYTATAFTNNDAPYGSNVVQRRQNVIFGSAGCKLPLDVPGISASGTNEKTNGQDFDAHFTSIKTGANLGRNEMFELGRKGIYHRYVTFPVEIKTDYEVISTLGDSVQALEEADNLTYRTLSIKTSDGLFIDLGSKNKLSSVTYGGANAGSNGGNATCTYSFVNYNDFSLTHPQDPSGL
jgi:hypothetical protein